jgi:hypothetical protein
VNRFSYYHLVTLIAVVLLVPAGVEAQSRGTSVTLQGTVSATVALSLPPNSTHSNIHVDTVSSGSTVRMTLSGTDHESSVIRVPLIVRSNSGFRISAVVESKTAELAQLSVIDVRATGTWVSPEAISGLEVTQQFDRRGMDEGSSATSASSLDLSRPLLVLSGPRVSLGGTLDSPNNALQITLLIRMKPQPGRDWLVHLTFAGTAVNIF